MSGDVIGTAKAALWLGISERAVRDLCVKGRLKSYQPSGYNGRRLIYTASLETIRPCPEYLRAETAETA